MNILSFFRTKVQQEVDEKEAAIKLQEQINKYYDNTVITSNSSKLNLIRPATSNAPVTITLGGSTSGGTGPIGLAGAPGSQTYQSYQYAPTPVITVHPYGYNNQPLTDNLAIIAIRTFADVHANGCFQHNDIVLCLDTKEMFMYSSPLMTGEPTWYKIEILPNLVIEIQEFEVQPIPSQPVEVKEDRKEVYDAFEKNLKPIEKPKHDSTSFIDKAKDWLRAPLEPVTQSYQ